MSGRARWQWSYGFLAGEFVVLVFGVFLGVQVDRWYEERQEARQDRNYLHRLVEDVAIMQRFYQDLAPRMAADTQKALRARRIVETCDPSGDDLEILRTTLSEHQWLPSFPRIRAAYDEMIASGAFARIDNADLKSSTAGLYSVLDWAADTVNYQRQDLGRASNLLLGLLAFTNDEEGQLAMGDFEIESLCGEPRIQSALAEVADSRADWGMMVVQVLEHLDQVEGLLDEELGARGGVAR